VTMAASANKSRELRRRAKRYGAYHLQAGTIGAACDRFLKDRGLIGTRTLAVSNRAGLSVWESKCSRDFRAIRKSFSFSLWKKLPLVYPPISRSQSVRFGFRLQPVFEINQPWHGTSRKPGRDASALDRRFLQPRLWR
jgi:hypothetical protein